VVRRRLSSSTVAILLLVVATLGGTLISSSTALAARPDITYCSTTNGFEVCLPTDYTTIYARGYAHSVCAIYPAYSQLTSPSGHTTQSGHVSHWCGSPTLQTSQGYSSGTWYASIWEGLNSSGGYTELASVHHNY
jgi:hypothetical protein